MEYLVFIGKLYGLDQAFAQGKAESLLQQFDLLLLAVDLGPNLAITGSLATLLWLAALRRERIDVGFWSFLKVGLVAMPMPLALTLLGRLVLG